MALLTVLAAMGGCASGSNGDGDAGNDTLEEDSAETVTFSGTFSLDDSSGEDARISLRKDPSRRLNRTTHSAAPTPCTDGHYYKMACIPLTDEPVALNGAVDCESGGGFYMDAVPKGVEIGCFLKRADSAEGPFQTVGSITLPTTADSGTNATLDGETSVESNFALEAAMDITVLYDASEGAISTAVLTDGRPPRAPGTFPPTFLNGPITLVCDPEADTGATEEEADQCNLGEADSEEEEALPLDFNVYTATVEEDLPPPEGAAPDAPSVPAGTEFSYVTAWETDTKTGGEGFNDLEGRISWADSEAEDGPTAELDWADSVTVRNIFDPTSTVALTLPAFPADSTSRDQWLTFINALLEETEISSLIPSACATNPRCRMRTAARLLTAFRESRAAVPDISLRLAPGSMSGTFNLNAIRLLIEGLISNYPDAAWSNDSDYSGHFFLPRGPLGVNPVSRLIASRVHRNGGVASIRSAKPMEIMMRCLAPEATASEDRYANATGCDGTQLLACRLMKEIRLDAWLGASEAEAEPTTALGLFTRTTTLANGTIMGTVPAEFPGAVTVCRETLADLLRSRQHRIQLTKEPVVE